MFYDLEGLFDKVRNTHPAWQLDAIKAIEEVLTDQDDWISEGKPNASVWEWYKLLRDDRPDLPKFTERVARKALDEAGVPIPKPRYKPPIAIGLTPTRQP